MDVFLTDHQSGSCVIVLLANHEIVANDLHLPSQQNLCNIQARRQITSMYEHDAGGNFRKIIAILYQAPKLLAFAVHDFPVLGHHSPFNGSLGLRDILLGRIM